MRVELYKGNVLDGDPLEQEYFSDVQEVIDDITSSYYAAVVFIDGREECVNVLDLWH